MKRLFSIFVGILACCIVVSAQSYVRAGDGDYGKILFNILPALKDGDSQVDRITFFDNCITFIKIMLPLSSKASGNGRQEKPKGRSAPRCGTSQG